MAINCYTGLMGSGKTYEVVEHVIIPNIKKGRRIVTNINGLNEEKVKDFILSKDKKFNPANLGSIKIVTDEEAMREDFFPQDDPSISSIVQRGDFVVIDEAWKQWGSTQKILPQHLLFFTKHRHFTSESGISCDLVIIVQDISIINRTLKSLIEMTTRTKKLKSIGMSSAYTVQIYEGNRLTRKFLINTITRKYNKDIFPLYKSYASGNGKELGIDKRTNIFSPKLLIFIVILVSIFALCFSFIYDYFNSAKLSSKSGSNHVEEVNNKPSNSGETSPQRNQVLNSAVSKDTQYRLIGVIDTPSKRLILVEDIEKGDIKMVIPSLCKGVGISLTCSFDNQEINYYSGFIKPNNNFVGGITNEKTNNISNN